MKALSPAEVDSLSKDLAALRALNREQLKERWQQVFKHPIPIKLGDSLVIGALAFRLQQELRGGLKPGVRRRLQVEPTVAPPKPELSPGTVLIRQWQGVTHTVTVLERGVMFRGRAFRSLTEVARTITGTHQSGPIFFGLRPGRKRRD